MNIKQYIEQFRGTEIWFRPNPGNGGDALIAFAAISLFNKMNIQFQIIQESDDLTGKVVFYGGGGNFVEMYSNCSDFVRDNHKKAKQLVILPQTISGHKALLSDLGDNVTIFCREQVSFDYVKTFENLKKVHLSDDLVFLLNVSESFPNLLPASRLISLVKPRRIVGSIIKEEAKKSDFLKSWKKTSSLNAFRIDIESTSIPLQSDNVDVTSLINLDFSMRDLASVEKTTFRIFSFLNQFSEIRTNRLHVCIAGALLGKTVRFYGNSYHKNESIFKFSIHSKYANVTWMGYS